MSSITNEIQTRKQASFDALKDKRLVWDSVEQLFHGQLSDQITSKTKSQVFDHRLSTLVIERAYRVMAQLPVGKIVGISKNDLGDAKLKSLILDKYIVPNANAQFDFLTKLRMVDMYSNIYGSFYTLVDWDVKRNGYVGPDIWLLNIRDVFPQVGAVSIDDSDYVIVRTWQPLSYFEGLKKKDGFKNVPQIIEKLKKRSGSKQGRDSENQSKRGEDQYPDTPEVPGKGFYEVLTQFERDRWVDYCPAADLEFRDTKNPHDNGELPIACKYSMPLLDDVMGMGDMERGGPMQKVINAVWNLYLDGVKMSIFPPALLNKDNIASMSSIKWGAAEKWLVRGQIDNAVKTIQLSPQGIQTFNNTQQVANASLLNLFGTSDTTVTQNTDVGYGKTPQALQMQQARENTRDLADRFYMERYLTSVMKKMVNLISKKQSSSVTIRMFKEEIDELAKSYPEVAEMYDEKKGKLMVTKNSSGSNLYDYEIVSGSTAASDQKSQQENLTSLITLYMKSQTPNGNTLVADLDKEGYTLKFGELFKKVIANSGIQDWDKILVEKTEEEKAESVLSNDAQIFQNVLTQMQQGQNMNATPPQPDQMGGQIPPQMEQIGGMQQ